MKVMLQSWSVRGSGALGAALALGALLAALALLPSPAQAEPYLTVRDGYKCSKCHVNKTGGGMRTDYAKVYMGTRLAARPGFGAQAPSADGKGAPKADLATGRFNPYFAVGADLRADVVYTHRGNEQGHYEFTHASSDTACASCHTDPTTGGGKRAEIFARMEVEPDVASFVLSESLAPVVAAREMFGLLDVLPGNGYVKAGTFRLPTGFNNTFDEPFWHTNQGTGATVPMLETVRGSGVEVGFEPGPISVSLSVTNPINPLLTQRQKRVVVNAYAVSSLGVVGVTSYKDPISDTKADAEYRSLQGAYLGLSLGRFTGLVERDDLTTHQTAGETKQRAVLAQLDVLLTRGHNFKLQYEYIDPDTTKAKDKRDRRSFVYEPFLTPYLQFRLGYRLYDGPTQANPATVDKNNGRQAFAELHFMY